MSLRVRLAFACLPLFLASCSWVQERGTLAELRDMKVELKEVKVQDGLDKAMQAYQKFLKDTPDSALTPEAIRRVADLKLEKEYGVLEPASTPAATAESAPKMDAPESAVVAGALPAGKKNGESQKPAADVIANNGGESDKDFEKRATAQQKITSGASKKVEGLPGGDSADLENADAREAIALYQKLLKKYPLYSRNDQVLYQMSRAYEELGDVDSAMGVMNRMVKEYPSSRYIDEVQFRRAEYFFTRKKWLDAEDAYGSIVKMGVKSDFYELALYKLGWTFYKQELYEDALHRFVALLDHKVAIGYDFEHPQDPTEKKRVDDTFRVISLSFSYLGGADAIADYFSKYGSRSYEVDVYSNLGEHYLDVRRYQDAAATYKAFVTRNPFHRAAPRFDMRIIEIYKKGGFPKLVVDANKNFVTTYGLRAAYWTHFDVKSFPVVVGYLKSTLKELANHYHALYQDKRFAKDKNANFLEATKWYREFLASFPKDAESPEINYQYAELLLENKNFGEAALAYEQTAYGYPAHPKAAAAGYAAVYAYRQYLTVVDQGDRPKVKRDVIRSSLKFADAFPSHPKAAIVLGAAVDDLFEMKDYALAVSTGHKLIDNFPGAAPNIRRSAWLVVAHSSFELTHYKEAEQAYLQGLQLTAADDPSRPGLVDDLAASIYKQGEQARMLKDYKTAAEHFLRIAKVAPNSKIRPTAEYDAAAALIQLKDWDQAAKVLLAFRTRYPGNKLQADVTKKIAFVYKQAGKLALAAAEYERIETESKDEEVRREALLMAADLYAQAKEPESALKVYRRYVAYFPRPVEPALETRSKIAALLKAGGDIKAYFAELKQIVDADAGAGKERTDRTRYLAATSALALAEPVFDEFAAIKLVNPLKKNLMKKRAAMQEAMAKFGHLVDYQVGDVTAAATYYIAETYAEFNRALLKSERPTNLSALELEQYNMALEDQAYPFEEKGIAVHEKNVELLYTGLYDEWIEKSIAKLAVSMPAKYSRPEEDGGYIGSMTRFAYGQKAPTAVAAKKPASGSASGQAQPAQATTADAETGAAAKPESAPPAAEAKSGSEPVATPSVQPASSGEPAANLGAAMPSDSNAPTVPATPAAPSADATEGGATPSTPTKAGDAAPGSATPGHVGSASAAPAAAATQQGATSADTAAAASKPKEADTDTVTTPSASVAEKPEAAAPTQAPATQPQGSDTAGAAAVAPAKPAEGKAPNPTTPAQSDAPAAAATPPSESTTAGDVNGSGASAAAPAQAEGAGSAASSSLPAQSPGAVKTDAAVPPAATN